MNASYNLDRFVEAQEAAYSVALSEVRNGRKVSHWMWYIFPQLQGLGRSAMAQFYGIEDLEEAKAYLAHELLGQRLRQITQVLLELPETDPKKIFGQIDSVKLRSCMTLFAHASGEALFTKVLEKYYSGEEDHVTMRLLSEKA